MAMRVHRISRLWYFEESMSKSIGINNVYTKSLFPKPPTYSESYLFLFITPHLSIITNKAFN